MRGGKPPTVKPGRDAGHGLNTEQGPAPSPAPGAKNDRSALATRSEVFASSGRSRIAWLNSMCADSWSIPIVVGAHGAVPAGFGVGRHPGGVAGDVAAQVVVALGRPGIPPALEPVG